MPSRSSTSTNVADGPSEFSPAVPAKATLTPGQRRTRARVETVIGLAAPFLDLVLAVGDRISRLAEPEDYEYYPVRAGELAERSMAEGASDGRPSEPSASEGGPPPRGSGNP